MRPRNIMSHLQEALSDTPVVLLNGARQTGKSTLVESLLPKKYPATYYTLDNLSTLASIKADPEGFIKKLSGPVVLDEIQKAPELFPVIKESVDKNRKPGRFLLTGSANIMLLPELSESLAGRMEIISLWPLSQGEIQRRKESFIDNVFAKTFSTEKKIERLTKKELFERILIGGYPEVLTRESLHRRHVWFQSYITTLLQKDVRDFTNIENLSVLPRLLALLASRASSLMNYAEFSRTSTIPGTTLMRYLTLFQALFLIYTVPAWSNNLSKRLVKTPKLYLNDTGLIAHLMGIDQARIELEPHLAGMFCENFVVTELKKQLTWSEVPANSYHYRTQGGQEVDVILENSAGHCVGIEIKSSQSVTEKDFNGMKVFAEHAGKKFIRGIVLYAGDNSLPFGDNLYAVPISALWA